MKMRFLTDENVATSVVSALRRNDYDVKDIKEEGLFGLSDAKVLELANKEDRIIITHDKDFSNLLNNPHQKYSGVILLQFSDQSPENVIKKLIPLPKRLEKRLRNSFVIITDDYVRIM